MEPRRDFVLLERIEQESDSAIITPDVAKELSDRARVVAVGDGEVVNGVLRPINLDPGDEVQFMKYGEMPVEVDGKKLVIVRDSEIYLRIPKRKKRTN